MRSRRLSVQRLAELLHSGERVFVGGSTAEPTALVQAWADDPGRADGLHIITSFVPGINPPLSGSLPRTVHLTGMFPQPAADGRTQSDVLPLSYFGFVRALRLKHIGVDTAVVHVSPPDREGRCCFGPTVEFMPAVCESAARILAVVNESIPAWSGSVWVPAERIAAYCESDAPLRTYASGTPDVQSDQIAAQVAPFVGDDAQLQIGLGKVPTALLARLGDRRNLRLHSGLVTEGVISLLEDGALAHERPSLACAMLGGPDFYRWLSEGHDVLVRGCELTHDPAVLAGLDRFVAVNSALEVDLLGQANLEFAGSRALSAAGGAPDFAGAASRGGGISIVALPALTGKGVSRIVPMLNTATSLPRHSIDLVVTEFGVADLRGLPLRARAEALVEIAAPEARGDLSLQVPQVAD